MAKGEDRMKHLKILHLEDNAMKQTAIARVLHDACEAEIDWVTDVASGMKKIEEAKEQGDMYDLAITDMQYPLKKDAEIDEEAGEVFIGQMKAQNVEIPIIVCSSMRLRILESYGCVWYHERNDWEMELRGMVRNL